MSFRALVVFVFLAVVSAFAPVSRVASRAALKMATEPMVGGSVEVKFLLPNSFEKNDVVYDPLDMLKLHDLNPEVFPHPKWLRESELKHCRIAMLAAIGAYTSQLGLVIPGYEDSLKADPTENLNNFFTTHPEGIAQIILAIGIVEGTSQPGDFWWGKGEREAGAWSFDPTNFYGKLTQQKKNELTLKELKNGRLAMIAVAGYFANHWIPGALPITIGQL